jgi:hypothetical protein
MKVMISQSNYIPWHGFFAALRAVDLYVILDTVQFTRRDWRSRNRILMNEKPKWLTVPVSGPRSQRINEVVIADPAWPTSHLGSLKAAYGRQMSDEVRSLFEEMYAEVADFEQLTQVNEILLKRLAESLEIKTPFVRSEELPDSEDPSERLALMAESVGATEYWSGPAAQDYMDFRPFDSAGIPVNYFDFSKTTGSVEDRRAGRDAGFSVVHDLAERGLAEAARRTGGLR